MSNPYGKYNGNELEYVSRLLSGTVEHDYVRELEGLFSGRIGNQYAIAVNSGTSALHAALVACDVSGGEVLMPALCPAMVAFAVIHAGATPVFCDVDHETHHISHSEVHKKITKKTRVILGVSLHGLPMNWAPFQDIEGVLLLDDCAQALGAKGIGKAHITCFSFEDKKHITSGSEGGMITTNNDALAIRARKCAGLGYKHMTADAGRTSLAQATYQDPSYERFDTIGLNYRMSQIQAAVGLGQMERLDHIVARRRAVANIMSQPLMMIEHPASSYYTLPYYFDGVPGAIGLAGLISEKRIQWKEFYNRFIEKGGDGFYAMPQLPYNEPALFNKGADGIGIGNGPIHCPIAEDLQKRLMLFKTNYRNLGDAEKQAEILAKLIGEL